MEDTALLASALSHGARLTILQLLLQSGTRGMIVGDIQKAIGMPGSTLSHHLDRLKEAGLVTNRRQGTFLWYLAVPDEVRAFAELLLRLSAGLAPAQAAEPVTVPGSVDEVEIEAD